VNVPGPRTNPTVQSTTKNRRSLRSWELRLGLPQVVVLVGLVTGSMVLAFYLGLNSGQRLGFELAQERTASSLPRLPVPGALPEGSVPQDDGAFDVYAKLNDTLPGAKGEVDPIKVAPVPEAESPLQQEALFPPASGEKGKTGAMPELGSIKSVESEPLINAEAEAALNARLEEKMLPEGNTEGGTLGDAASAIARTDTAEVKPAPIEEVKKIQESAPKTEVAKAVAPAVEKAEPEKAVAKVAPKTTNSPFIKKNLPKGWFAQVGAMQSLSDAEGIATKLKSSGFAVMIESAQVRGESYFRIMVGPEKSREQADILVSQLRRERYIEGDPFLRVVK